MKKVTLFSLLLSLLFTRTSAQDAGNLSGILKDGLRRLSVDAGPDPLAFTVYRGDYIVFDFSQSGSFRFQVPDLSIDITMPRPAGQTAYVKVKESGTFAFTLGERKGTLEVIELEGPGYRKVTAEEAVRLIEESSPFILDVRTPQEFAAGHIEGSTLLPVQELFSRMEQLAGNEEEPVLVVCATGNRSTVASHLLMRAGFTRVYNLRYGIKDWARQGHPVIK